MVDSLKDKMGGEGVLFMEEVVERHNYSEIEWNFQTEGESMV